MANPAIKNGYIPIATELVEKMALINIPGNEMRIIWVLWRKTWGWKEKNRKKDWDWISYTQFAALTGIKRRNCVECIKSLVSKSILLKKENSYKFNQDYDSWVVSKRTPSVQKHTRVVSKSITRVVSKSRPTIDNKETITKETPESNNQSTEIPTLIKAFEGVNPACSKFYGNTVQRRACEDLIKSYGFERVLTVIEKTLPKTNGLQYFPSITTPLQLNDKWASLESAVLRHQSKKLENKTNIAFC